MFTYVAVDAGDLSGIYECPLDENAEEWLDESQNYLFKDFNSRIPFTSDTNLKIGKELSVCLLEGSNGKQDIREEIFLTSLTNIIFWIESHVRRLTGSHDFIYSHLRKDWLDDFEINGWTFDINCITTKVKHDPRNNPWRVKLESYGLNYDIIVDPVSSGFNECYEKQILPALQEMASEDTVFVEDDEIKRLILPEMVKLTINFTIHV